ncbi:MAG: hypothetical protein ABSB18_02970 [Candidatus Omnitrophota bacterium]
MKLIFFSRLLIRFSRIKIKRTKNMLTEFLGDNYPICAFKTKSIFYIKKA